jgi:hypothetical protein
MQKMMSQGVQTHFRIISSICSKLLPTLSPEEGILQRANQKEMRAMK